MRVVRIFGTWVTVVVAVAAWILFVPVFNVLGSLVKRLSGLADPEPYRHYAFDDEPGLQTNVDQPSYQKEHGKQAA